MHENGEAAGRKSYYIFCFYFVWEGDIITQEQFVVFWPRLQQGVLVLSGVLPLRCACTKEFEAAERLLW